MTGEKRTISLLVENVPGVLSRIAGLFSGRGFNIEGIAAAPTMDRLVTRITITTTGDESIMEQINKQLNKLVNVIKVQDLTETDFVEREMALVKVKAEPANRAEILRLVDIFRCKIVDVSPSHYTIEVTGTGEKLAALLELLKMVGIKEIARTGSIALTREKK